MSVQARGLLRIVTATSVTSIATIKCAASLVAILIATILENGRRNNYGYSNERNRG